MTIKELEKIFNTEIDKLKEEIKALNKKVGENPEEKKARILNSVSLVKQVEKKKETVIRKPQEVKIDFVDMTEKSTDEQ